MKKWIIAIAGIALAISSLPGLVFAEDSTTVPSTTSGTSTTATTTPSDELIFDFVYDSDYSIKVTWNAEDAGGLSVKSVKIGNIFESVNDNTGSFFVNIYELPPGIYDVIFEMDDSITTYTCDKKVVRAGELSINVNLRESDGYIAASIIDDYGRPVVDCEVLLYISGSLIEEIDPQFTDRNGNVVFPVPVPEDKTKVMCKVESFYVPLENGEIYYEGAEGFFPKDPPSSTPSTSTTTTKPTTSTSKGRTTTKRTQNITTTAPTTKQTLPIVTGAGTTAVLGDKIAVNVSFDTGVAESFKYSSKDFAARARLLVSKAMYSDIVGGSSATIMLLAQTSNLDITDQHIFSAISGKSKYSLFQPEQTLRIPINMSLLIVDNQHKVNTPVSMPESEVIIELPVPKPMRNTSDYTIVAALCNENGISQFLETKVDNGILQFKTNRLSSIVILGFDNSMGLGINGGGIPYIAIGIIVLGLLMLAGAGALLYFFFIRKPIPADDSQEEMQYFHPQTPYNLNTELKTQGKEDSVSLGSLLNKDLNDE